MDDQWTCRECGRTHQIAILTCDHGGPSSLGGFTKTNHRHEYWGYKLTGGPTCRICGQSQPPQPGYTISNVTHTFTPDPDTDWSYT